MGGGGCRRSDDSLLEAGEGWTALEGAVASRRGVWGRCAYSEGEHPAAAGLASGSAELGPSPCSPFGVLVLQGPGGGSCEWDEARMLTG
jgi:hypothetical protein